PFAADNSADMLAAHLCKPPDRPSTFRPALPAALDGLVLRMLEKDPADRPTLALVRFALLALATGTPDAPAPLILKPTARAPPRLPVFRRGRPVPVRPRSGAARARRARPPRGAGRGGGPPPPPPPPPGARPPRPRGGRRRAAPWWPPPPPPAPASPSTGSCS